jgi:hypothetical protein
MFEAKIRADFHSQGFCFPSVKGIFPFLHSSARRPSHFLKNSKVIRPRTWATDEMASKYFENGSCPEWNDVVKH